MSRMRPDPLFVAGNGRLAAMCATRADDPKAGYLRLERALTPRKRSFLLKNWFEAAGYHLIPARKLCHFSPPTPASLNLQGLPPGLLQIKH